MGQIELRDLGKSFNDNRLFAGFNLTIPNGKLTVILGPSGCGKSTLLRLIAGLETPEQGRILIGNEDVTNLEPRRRRVAMVFQNYALYPHLTVRQNLSFPLRVAKLPRPEIEQKVGSAAEMLGLDELLDRYPKTLSGGERQRTAVGRALVRDPQLFLFDEPLSNLDFQLRHHMRGELVALQRRLGKTMVYVTHDQTEGMTMADLLVLLERGRIRQAGQPQELYEQPADIFVARFIGAPPMNIFPARVRGGQLDLSGIETPLASVPIPDGDYQIGIRPGHIRLDEASSLRIEVGQSEYHGAERYLFGVLGKQQLCLRVDPEYITVLGDSLGITLPVGKLHFFDQKSGRRVTQSGA
jgi:sn-glycerol 3-phosphate transport system ATP-binding protein